MYFTTPHFDGYAMVLVRLAEIGQTELTELITDAWLVLAPTTLVKSFSPTLLDQSHTQFVKWHGMPFTQPISTCRVGTALEMGQPEPVS